MWENWWPLRSLRMAGWRAVENHGMSQCEWLSGRVREGNHGPREILLWGVNVVLMFLLCSSPSIPMVPCSHFQPPLQIRGPSIYCISLLLHPIRLVLSPLSSPPLSLSSGPSIFSPSIPRYCLCMHAWRECNLIRSMQVDRGEVWWHPMLLEFNGQNYISINNT